MRRLVLVMLLLAVPLTGAMNQLVTQRERETTTQSAVDLWANGLGLTLVGMSVGPQSILVDVAGDAAIPDLTELKDQIGEINGSPLAITVRRAAQTTARGPKPSATPANSELSESRLRPIVEDWFGANQPAEVTSIELSGKNVSINATGPGPSPDLTPLAATLNDATGSRLTVELNWTQEEQSNGGDRSGAARIAAVNWAQQLPGVDVIGVSASPEEATVTIAASQPPSTQQTAQLTSAIQTSQNNPQLAVTVLFSQLTELRSA